MVQQDITQENKHDPAQWLVHTRIDKYEGDLAPDEVDAAVPYETVEKDGNLLLIGGVSFLFQAAIGNGTGTAAQALTYFNNGNARIGVGDSSTAEADTQTALQAATNKVFVAMDSTYPQHTDSTGTAGSKTITFRSTYGSAVANFAWAEWGIDNGTRLLNRKVAANGTKASGSTWVFTVTVALA
jgi:hypothetical protein